MLLFTLLHFVETFVVANTLLSVGDYGKTLDKGLEYGAIDQPGSFLSEVLDTATQLRRKQDASFSHLWNNVPTSDDITKIEDGVLTTVAKENTASADYDTLSLAMDHKLVQPVEVNRELARGFQEYDRELLSLDKAISIKSNIGQKEIVHQRLQRSVVGTANSTPVDITKLFEGVDKAGKENHLAEGGGVSLNISTILSSTSPEQLSSTTRAPLDDNHQSGADYTHSVEGGGVPLNTGSPTKLANLTQTSLATTLQTETTPTNISMQYNSQEDPNNVLTSTSYRDPKSHKTVPRKGAEAGKIVGRKGVDDIRTSARPKTINDTSSPLILTSNHSIDGALAAHLNLSSNNATLSPSLPVNGKVEIIESNPPLKKKPNSKPLTLTDKTSFNTTPAPHDHVSSQRDLVVPVVALILAVPLVTILGIFLYKKGSEYWSRRHYRRMDFLIDGMYND